MDMSSKNSSGYDNISPKLIKSIAPLIVPSLTLIINQSLTTGVFPDKLKIAKVIPIYKKLDKTQIQNYRPISLLPSFSKIFEKIAYNQLYNYFLSNNLLCKSQYGFRKKHSTDHAILELADRILLEMDKGNTPIAIFLDLSKAFDTLDHTILLQKLKYYGISETSLKWFQSYITNRKQYVQFQNVKSNLATISTGVPQGSIIGPLLFIIYINDLSNATSFFNPMIYADDTCLINSLQCYKAVSDSHMINDELNNIYLWLSVNELSLNVNKTKYILFSTTKKKRKLDPPAISINGSKIEKVHEFNFLGVTFDQHMTWASHIHKVSCKLSRNAGIISKLKYTLPCYTLKTLYDSLIQSHLHYGLLAWGAGNTDRVLKIQKKVIRTISNSKYNSHTEPIFKALCILKLPDLFKLNILKFYYDFEQGTLPHYLQSYDVRPRSTVHNYNTRHSTLLCTNTTKCKFAEKSLRNQIPIIVNSTSLNIISNTDRS